MADTKRNYLTENGATITIIAYLACFLMIAGWIDCTRWWKAAAGKAIQSAPEVQAAQSTPAPQCEPEPSAGTQSESRVNALMIDRYDSVIQLE
jgi:hypothetical protein